MIPVEDAAGGAAFVLHNKSERTPYKNADKITHVEDHGNEKQPHPADHSRKIKHADNGNQPTPEQQHLVGGTAGRGNVISQGGGAYLFPDRTEVRGKQLHRADRNSELVIYRDYLQEHIEHP